MVLFIFCYSKHLPVSSIKELKMMIQWFSLQPHHETVEVMHTMVIVCLACLSPPFCEKCHTFRFRCYKSLLVFLWFTLWSKMSFPFYHLLVAMLLTDWLLPLHKIFRKRRKGKREACREKSTTETGGVVTCWDSEENRRKEGRREGRMGFLFCEGERQEERSQG